MQATDMERASHLCGQDQAPRVLSFLRMSSSPAGGARERWWLRIGLAKGPAQGERSPALTPVWEAYLSFVLFGALPAHHEPPAGRLMPGHMHANRREDETPSASDLNTQQWI